MPHARIPQDVYEKIMAIKDKRGYRSFGFTLQVLLGNLNPDDIPDEREYDIAIGVELRDSPFIRRRTLIKTKTKGE